MNLTGGYIISKDVTLFSMIFLEGSHNILHLHKTLIHS